VPLPTGVAWGRRTTPNPSHESHPSATTEPDSRRPGKQSRVTALLLDPARLPAHVAVIMDGNGRWVASATLPQGAWARAQAWRR